MKSRISRVRFPYSVIGIILVGIFFLFSGTVFKPGGRASAQNAAPTPTATRMPMELEILMGKTKQAAIDAAKLEVPAASPVRGVGGDAWADVIVGQPGFGQITPNQVVANKLFNPDGVHVDRSVVPNRVYVYDAGNSRILAFSSLGACAAGTKAGQACTSNSDCPGSACTINPTKAADRIIGQASPGSSTCNGDSGFQNYPDLPLPNASTLCGLRPEGASILEGGSVATMATDPDGNLYHPDLFNNRVLRYNNPFTHDTVADYEWGQAGFVSGSCNEGRSYGSPDDHSLCLAPPMGYGSIKSGVAIDSHRNLWVADTQNNRVLRFPYNAMLGVPAQTADLVLGQPDFTSAGSGNSSSQMNNPGSVRVDAQDNVYVLDGVDGWGTHGRLMIFKGTLSNGMAATQIFGSLGEPTGLEFDPSGALWVNNSMQGKILKLVNGQLQEMITGTPSGLWGEPGIDRDSNIYLTGWDPQQVLVYRPPSYSWDSTFLQADEYGSFNKLGPRGMTDPNGMEITADQLIVADQSRLLFWNNPTQLTNSYPAASGVVGQPNFTTRPRWAAAYGRLRADTHNRLWVVKGAWNTPHQILAYALPLTTGATPIIQISPPLRVLGGGSFDWSYFLTLSGLAYQPGCDCLWLSDTDNNRVFRIRNVSSPQRVVDIVLGQKRDPATLTIGTHCNQGRDDDNGYVHPTSPSRDSLCHPGALAFDSRGNLFVSDHNLEIAGNWRLLEYDAATLPNAPASPIFALPASRVYGRNGSFTEANCQPDDPMCGPWEPVLDANHQMTVGFNTYLGRPFPQIYHDPLANDLPYTALNDYFSHAYSARYDPFKNLFVLDLTRDRVMIYLAAPLTISGNVGLAGAKLSYVDGTAKTAVADGAGNYSFTVRSGWSGTVTPSAAGYGFWPISRTYSKVITNRTAQNYAVSPNTTISRKSIAAKDGWILESGESTNSGGRMDSTAITLRLGDDALNRQYRSIISFYTDVLPDTAVVQSAILKIRQSGTPNGANPFNALGNLVVDVQKGAFSNSAALQLGDFNAAASAGSVATFSKTPSNGWYTATLNASGRSNISKTGTTQFRLRFSLDDNNNHLADFMQFFSGDYALKTADRPTLVITYYVP